MKATAQGTKAMIFAAGLGTRLRPLTNDRPKALVEVNEKTLLQHAIEHLNNFGITTIIVNIHHFGKRILEVLEANQNFGCNIIISDERDALLETGGGLKKAAPLLQGGAPFVVYNVDVLSNINLDKMLDYHNKNGALATLATRNRKTSRYLLFNEQEELCGWKNINTKEIKSVREAQSTHNYAFSGIHIIDPKLLNLITEKGKFSITNTYLDLAKEHKIMAYLHDEDYWFDVGKHEQLNKAELFLANLNNDVKS
jgi:MurNAc alpha-1-phosphate uridylyltransferase